MESPEHYNCNTNGKKFRFFVIDQDGEAAGLDNLDTPEDTELDMQEDTAAVMVAATDMEMVMHRFINCFHVVPYCPVTEVNGYFYSRIWIRLLRWRIRFLRSIR